MAMENVYPAAPYILEFVSVTFGSKEYTAFVRQQLASDLAANPNIRSWDLPVSVDYFKEDPDSGIWKISVVVYRTSGYDRDSGNLTWSRFKTETIGEGDHRVFDFSGNNHVAGPLPPAMTARRQYIASASWHSADVTQKVQDTMTRSNTPVDQNLPVTISASNFGLDSSWLQGLGTYPSKGLTFAVTYGTYVYPGFWSYQVHTALHAGEGWTLNIPPAFPPANLPSSNDFTINYVTFYNGTTGNPGTILYPQIFAESGELLWDGRAENVSVASQTRFDLPLLDRVNCKEGDHLYAALLETRSGSFLQGDSSYVMTASSSTLAKPVNVGWYNSGFLFNDGQRLVHPGGPAHSPADLRLNIYSATWGDTDVTEFVRRHYITSTLVNRPTATSNSYTITPSNLNFGPDPNPNIAKALVIVYRLACVVGTTTGIINDPEFHPVLPASTNTSNADLVPALHTSSYPVLSPISQFYITGSKELNAIPTINLITHPQTPQTWPTPTNPPRPFIAAAAWSTRDVTSAIRTAYTDAYAAASGTSVPVPISFSALGSDPWENTAKQVSLLVGYPMTNVDATQGNYTWRTLAQINAAVIWNFQIPKAGSTPAPKAPAPGRFVAYAQPGVNRVGFYNKLGSGKTVWPLVLGELQQVVWDGRNVAGGATWRIDDGTTKTLDLLADTGGACIAGQFYSLNFSCDHPPAPSSTGWIKVAAAMDAKLSAKLTVQVDRTTKTVPGLTRWEVMKEIMVA